MTLLRIPEAARPAWDRLTLVLLEYEPPCAADPERWWSFDADDIEAAVYGCRRCRVVDQCATYADVADEPAGVWGAVDREHRRTTTSKGDHLMEDDDDRDDREFARRLFADPPPRDVVPGSGLTRDDLRRQNDNTGKVVEVTIPGEVIFDVDGMPIGVAPSRTERGIFGGVVITEADADRLGLTADDLARDYPNVRVHPTPNREGRNQL